MPSLSTEKPFELDVSGERMRFTGQIDRIDVGRVGDSLVFNVIDYKTSALARVKPDEVRSGLQIQLPLYAMAAAELLLADKQAAALSAGYWSIRGKGFCRRGAVGRAARRSARFATARSRWRRGGPSCGRSCWPGSRRSSAGSAGGVSGVQRGSELRTVLSVEHGVPDWACAEFGEDLAAVGRFIRRCHRYADEEDKNR